MGEEVWATIPAFGAAGPKQALEEALETRNSTTFEMFVPHLNRWFETSVYPFESGLPCAAGTLPRGGMPSVCSGTERLRLAPEVAMVGAWTNDLQNSGMVWSSELESMLSSRPLFDGAEEAFLTLVHRDDWSKVKEALARCKQDQVPFETEFRYSHPAERCAGCSFRAVDMWTMPDASHRNHDGVAAEAQRREAAAHTAAPRALGILAGGIAHDFNNLLLVIMGNANLASCHCHLSAR